MAIPSTGNLIDVYRLPTYSLQATPEAPFEILFQAEKNGPGTGQFSLPLDDAAYPDIGINDVVAIRRDGTTVFPFVVERIGEHTLDTREGSSRTATYQGRGVGVFLEWCVLGPAQGSGSQPVEEDAVFDWRSPRYDPADDSWGAANEIMTVATAEGGAWPHQPMAERFDLTTGAMMIGGPSGSDSYAPMGWTLYYRDITVAKDGRHGIEVLMDDLGLFWVDGVQQLDVGAEDGFVTASFKRLYLTAGVHRFCWAVKNFEDPDNPGLGLGPSALAYNFYKADLQDRPLAGGQYEVSDSTTKVLEVGTGTWPGMTVGDDLGQLVGEGQARGVFPWLAPSFTKADDSNAAAWDRISVTTKTGTTNLLQFMDELVAAGRVGQWRVRNDGVTFDLYKPGYTNPTAVTLAPAPTTDPRSGQLVQLDRTIT